MLYSRIAPDDERLDKELDSAREKNRFETTGDERVCARLRLLRTARLLHGK